MQRRYLAVSEDDLVEERERPGVVKLGGQEEAGGGRAHLMYLASLPLAEARYILARP